MRAIEFDRFQIVERVAAGDQPERRDQQLLPFGKQLHRETATGLHELASETTRSARDQYAAPILAQGEPCRHL